MTAFSFLKSALLKMPVRFRNSKNVVSCADKLYLCRTAQQTLLGLYSLRIALNGHYSLRGLPTFRLALDGAPVVFGFALLIAFAWDVAAQGVRGEEEFSKSYEGVELRSFHGESPNINYSFRPDPLTLRIKSKILVAAGFGGEEHRFSFRSAIDVPNAAAYMGPGDDRIIFYNVDFMQRLIQQSGDYWPLYAILAHEVAHHLRDHRSGSNSYQLDELAADYHAGFIMRRLGASLEQVRNAFFALIERPNASRFHPAREERILSATTGWLEAGDQREAQAARSVGMAQQHVPAPLPSRHDQRSYLVTTDDLDDTGLYKISRLNPAFVQAVKLLSAKVISGSMPVEEGLRILTLTCQNLGYHEAVHHGISRASADQPLAWFPNCKRR